MASGDRFYQLEFRHRPALWGDVGSLLKIEGIVIGGEGAQAVLMLPDHKIEGFFETPQDDIVGICNGSFWNLTPTAEEWSDWLQRSDNPEILVPNPDGSASLPKVFHRKLRYEISGAVQQKVWVADDYKCMYCGKPMGQVQLTIDHFMPLEMGGKNDPSNYLSACRKCNKDKGGMDPRAWCAQDKVKWDYDSYVQYLAERKLP